MCNRGSPLRIANLRWNPPIRRRLRKPCGRNGAIRPAYGRPSVSRCHGPATGLSPSPSTRDGAANLNSAQPSSLTGTPGMLSAWKSSRISKRASRHASGSASFTRANTTVSSGKPSRGSPPSPACFLCTRDWLSRCGGMSRGSGGGRTLGLYSKASTRHPLSTPSSDANYSGLNPGSKPGTNELT